MTKRPSEDVVAIPYWVEEESKGLPFGETMQNKEGLKGLLMSNENTSSRLAVLNSHLSPMASEKEAALAAVPTDSPTM